MSWSWKKFAGDIKGGIKDIFTDPVKFSGTYSSSFLDRQPDIPESDMFEVSRGIEVSRGKRSGFDWLKTIGGKVLDIGVVGFRNLPEGLKEALYAKATGMYEKDDRMKGLLGKQRGQRISISGTPSRSIPAAGRVQTSRQGYGGYDVNSVAFQFIDKATKNSNILSQIEKTYNPKDIAGSGKTITLSSIRDISPTKYRKYQV